MSRGSFFELFEKTKDCLWRKILRPTLDFLKVDLVGGLFLALGTVGWGGVDPLLGLYGVFLIFALACCVAFYLIVFSGVVLSILAVPVVASKYLRNIGETTSILRKMYMFFVMFAKIFLLILSLLLLVLLLYVLTVFFWWATGELAHLVIASE